MTQLNPYISFSGQAEEAFTFYKSVFGGEFEAVMRWGDNEECAKMPGVDKNGIMHIALPVGDSMIMGDDSDGLMGKKLVTGNNHSVSVAPDSREEADRLFSGLSEGGQATMEMQDTFWGGYFGMLTDKFGIQWLINYDELRSK